MSEVLCLDVGEVEAVHDHVCLDRVTNLNLLHAHASIALIHVVDREAVRAVGTINLDLAKRRVARSLQPHDRPRATAGPPQNRAVAVADELKIARRNLSVSRTS